VPTAQLPQPALPPPAKVPSAQFPHEVAPVSATTFPAAQGLQLLAAEAEYLPPAHAQHEFAGTVE